MSIPYSPSAAALSADPAGGSDHLRRLIMNPPADFIASAAAQSAIAAGRAPAPFNDGPVVFGPDGQAIMTPPPPGQAQGSWEQPADSGDWQNPGTPGSGVHYASGMGMGVESPNQQGLDDGWMQQIQGQIAASSPQSQGQSPLQPPEGDQTVGIMTAPASPIAPTGTIAPTESVAAASLSAASAAVTAAVSAISAAPSIRTASMAPSSSIAASLTSMVSETASASAAATDAAAHKPFTKSTAFILILVLCSLALFGIIATALRWMLRWKSKDGNDRYLGGMLHRRRRDIEADDLSDIVRHFGDSGGMIEKRSSLLAEEMGHAPYLHSDEQLRPVSHADLIPTDEPMEDIDLDEPRAPALHETLGSPSMPAGPCGTQRLEVRNIDPDEYEKAKTLPKSWVADRALANIANWPRSSASARSDSLGSDASLPSPFSAKATSNASDDEWPRSASQCSSRATNDPAAGNANWASTLRSSLFAAIGGKPEEDKYTRPVLPIHSRTLSRASTGRTTRSSLSVLAMSQAHTFGRAAGKGMVVDEKDEGDNYSVSSSARGEMRQALLLSEGRSTVGERYKVYARSLRSRDED